MLTVRGHPSIMDEPWGDAVPKCYLELYWAEDENGQRRFVGPVCPAMPLSMIRSFVEIQRPPSVRAREA